MKEAILSHLTAEEIENVIEMYEDNEIKEEDIIAAYNIKISPYRLHEILPPKVTNKICPYCGEKMYRKRESRDLEKLYNYINNTNAFCKKCGHQIITGTNQYCNCQNCKNKKQEELKEKQRIIREAYTKTRKRIDFEDLGIEDKIKFCYILAINPKRNVYQIGPLYGDNETTLDYLIRLYDIGAISVSPESNVDAFLKDNFPNVFDITKVIFDVNVVVNRNLVDSLDNGTYFNGCSATEKEKIMKLYKQYLYKDIITIFEEMLKKRKLELHISMQGKYKLEELIDTISYRQILFLCSRVAKCFSDKVLIGAMPSYVAKNSVLLNVYKFYERSVFSGWELIQKEVVDVTSELDFFIHIILGQTLDVLSYIPDNIDFFHDKQV